MIKVEGRGVDNYEIIKQSNWDHFGFNYRDLL